MMETTSDVDTDDELTKEFMRSFGEYDDDSTLAHENVQTLKITNPPTNMINNVLMDRAKFNTSYKAASAQCERLNSVPGAKLKNPTGKNQMKREADLKYDYDIYIFCDTCKLLFKKGEVCERCGKPTKKKEK